MHLKRLQVSHAMEDALHASLHVLALGHDFGLTSLPRCTQYFLGTLASSLCQPVDEHQYQVFHKNVHNFLYKDQIDNGLMLWKLDSKNFNCALIHHSTLYNSRDVFV